MLSPALLKTASKRTINARHVAPVLSAFNPDTQRRTFMSKQLYKLAKKAVPKMSNTERAALESGTVGFDRDLFSGAPSLQALKEKYSAVNTPEDQAFLDNEVQQLCEMLDDYSIMNDQDLPKEAWDFIKEKGFLGMIIPKEYGGRMLSAHGHSQVITKLASRSPAASVTVCVPNSLGPAELLLRYGTQEQKDYFLRDLATGKQLPCFGLTGPASGSDAASMRDKGVVCEQDGVLGIRASFSKRYITLAPVATCVGLALDISDPDRLLGSKGSEGITVVLVERNHKGLRMGKRHDTISIPFMNGPVEGEDVFIPMDKVIGGQERVGFGWNMLMDCLSEGRAISLPSSALAGAKMSSTVVGAYARIRKQFKVPVAELEGVQEHLATIASQTFIMQSGQHLVNAMINQHEQPAVLSGVAKYQGTERGREVVENGMDVLGGAGICRGPNNFMAAMHVVTPVLITVEGANTLTRSLIIYGQGLIRAHPHMYDLLKTIQKGDDVDGFMRELKNFVRHGFTNTTGSLSMAFRRSRSKSDLLGHYESQMEKLSRNFAMCADLSLTMGGKLKLAEMVSGRFADVFSSLYLGYATMWYYQNHQDVEGIDKVFDYAMTKLCYDIQEAIVGVSGNFPVPGVGPIMRRMCFPFGLTYKPPTDKQKKEVAKLISTDSGVRNMLAESFFISKSLDDRVALINDTLPKAVKADEILTRVRKEKYQPTSDEQKLIDEVEAAREIIIQVDSFDALGAEIHAGKDYVRPGFNGNALGVTK